MGSERAMGAEACNSLCSTLYLVLLYWAVLSCSKLNRAVLGYTTYATDCALTAFTGHNANTAKRLSG